QLVRVPFLALVRFHGRGKLVVRDGRHVFLGEAPEVGTDFVGAAIVEGVALDANLDELLSFLWVGLGEQRSDRLRPGRSTLWSRCGRSLFGAGREIDRLFERLRADELAGQNPGRHRDDHRRQDRGDYLVPFERSEERRVGKECRSRWWR